MSRRRRVGGGGGGDEAETMTNEETLQTRQRRVQAVNRLLPRENDRRTHNTHGTRNAVDLTSLALALLFTNRRHTSLH